MAKSKKQPAPSPQAAAFKDRIVGFERLDPSQLAENPKNWRHHPPAQALALRSILAEIGVADAAIARKLPSGQYQLLDGHLRKTLIRDQPIPTLILDLDDAEADKFLLTLDPIAGMAEALDSKLRELKASVQIPAQIEGTLNKIIRAQEAQVAAAVAAVADIAASFQPAPSAQLPPPSNPNLLTDDGTVLGGALPPAEDYDALTKPGSYDGVWQLRENVVFPASNEWGIPDLRTDLLSPHVPTETWGRQPITDAQHTFFLWGSGPFPEDCAGGTIGFFVDDYRFEHLWNDAVTAIRTVKAQKWGAICTPDFSLYWEWPLALKLYNLYRSRWIARYAQEMGIPIVPTLVRTGNPALTALECAGLPFRPPVVGTQCRTGQRDTASQKVWIASTNNQTALVQPEHVFIYGGLTHRNWLEPNLAPGPTYHYLEDFLQVRKRVSPSMRKGKKDG